MKIVPAKNLVCPLDGKILQICYNHLICSSGHTFDLAHDGYVNLLPVQFKKSKNPGDSKQMVSARRSFLDAGYYAPIAEQLCTFLDKHIKSCSEATVLDAGCGEGYYLDYFLDYLTKQNRTIDLTLIGMDISKWAVIKAAKRNKNITWIVATNKSPPLEPLSLDIVICAFGFCNLSVMSSVLKRRGLLVLVDPGPNHLIELRNIIYDTINKQKTFEKKIPPEYKLVESFNLDYHTGSVPNVQLQNLLFMTPHLYRASFEGKRLLKKLDMLELTVDIDYTLLIKE